MNNRRIILLCTTIIFGVLLDIHAILEARVFPEHYWKYNFWKIVSIIILIVWYICELWLLLKERDEKKGNN